MTNRIAVVLLFCILPAWAASGTPEKNDPPRPGSFSVLHITDTHFSPHHFNTPTPQNIRGEATFSWMAKEIHQPQKVSNTLSLKAPAFILVTGDLTEFGVVDDTYDLFEETMTSFKLPLYVTPGNHDNTWVAMYHIMRRKHGAEHYSVDNFGVHFVFLNTASPQEPVPSIGPSARGWLRQDLMKIPIGTPVVLSMHHPLDSSSFTDTGEYDQLMDILRDYNIALVLCGHGHSAFHKSHDGIDSVMGGATFGKNAGYGLLSVDEGKLRYAYRYFDESKANERTNTGASWKLLLEKPLTSEAPNRLLSSLTPTNGFVSTEKVMAVDLSFSLSRDVKEAADAKVKFTIDGHPATAKSTPSPFSDELLHAAFLVSLDDLTEGGHTLTARARMPNGKTDMRSIVFYADHRNDLVAWRKLLQSPIKAAPSVIGESLIVADTAGTVRSLNRSTSKEQWSFTTGGEILGKPAASGERIIFGSGDFKVYALNNEGKKLWTYDTGVPVYSPPVIHDDTAYIGDNSGRMHALDVTSGKARWVFSRAMYSIEAPALMWDNLLVFGAWDGYIYALKRATGELAWKALGPKSSEKTALRYYSPADCGFSVVKNKLFVCDRGYYIGVYDKKGNLTFAANEKISGLTDHPKEQAIYARATNNRLCRFDDTGKKVWEIDIPTGRFPIAPTLLNSTAFICSDTGLLSAVETSSGKIKYSYQATPGSYVMAPVEVDEEMTCYVAGMDGSITAIKYNY